jgi:ketosteroid isomerase-like protein
MRLLTLGHGPVKVRLVRHEDKIKRRTALAVFLLLLSLMFACQTQTASDTRATDEAALRNLDDQWSKAAGAKDVDKTVSYYANDAIVMPPNTPMATGKEPIRAIWKGMLGAPGFSGGWKSTKVEVAQSGDLGYVIGTYEFTENDAAGKPMTDRGKYLEVWKKQADGNWKCVADIFNTDLPLAAPPPMKKAEP